MNEFITMLKSPQFKAYSTIFLGVVVIYSGFQIYKTILDAKFQRQNIKLNKFRIVEYKQKYSSLMADKGTNETVKFIDGSVI